jgi:hypothetical protein
LAALKSTESTPPSRQSWHLSEWVLSCSNCIVPIGFQNFANRFIQSRSLMNFVPKAGILG